MTSFNVEREQVQSTNIDSHTNLNFDHHHHPPSPILRPLKRKPSSCLCQTHDSSSSSVGGDECHISVGTGGMTAPEPTSSSGTNQNVLVASSSSSTAVQHLQIILERHPSPDASDDESSSSSSSCSSSSQGLGSPSPCSSPTGSSSSSSDIIIGRAGTSTTATQSPAEEPMEVEEAQDEHVILLSNSPSQDPDRRSQSPVHSPVILNTAQRVLPHVYHEPWVSPNHHACGPSMHVIRLASSHHDAPQHHACQRTIKRARLDLRYSQPDRTATATTFTSNLLPVPTRRGGISAAAQTAVADTRKPHSSASLKRTGGRLDSTSPFSFSPLPPSSSSSSSSRLYQQHHQHSSSPAPLPFPRRQVHLSRFVRRRSSKKDDFLHHRRARSLPPELERTPTAHTQSQFRPQPRFNHHHLTSSNGMTPTTPTTPTHTLPPMTAADTKGKAKEMGVAEMPPSRQNSAGMGVPTDSTAGVSVPPPSTPSGSEDESSPTRHHHRHASASAASSSSHHRHLDQSMSPASSSSLPFKHPLSVSVKLGPASPFGSSPSSAGSLFATPLGSPGYCQQQPPVVPQTHPLITRDTLKELELEVTLRSPQLRHDLLFDPGLQFRPTSGRRKREQTERYWEAIAREMQYGCTCTCFDRDNRVYACVCGKVPGGIAANAMFKPSVAPIAACWNTMVLETKSRILPLLQTLKEVLHLVIHPAVNGSAAPSSNASSVASSPPTSPTQASYHTAPSSTSGSSSSDPLLAAFDPVLIQQEIQHGVFDYRSVFKWLGEIMKTHCAPMRDAMVESMVRMGTMEDLDDALPRERRPVKALRMCFEILEVMKLDIANHQLQALRPYLLETCPDFELKTFQERFEKGLSGLDITRRWISRAIAAAPTPSPPSRSKHVMTALCSAMVNVVFEPPAPDAPTVPGVPAPEKAFPETLYLDHTRLNNYVNDAADLLGLYMLIMLFRQLTTSGAGSLEDWEIDRIKREVWEVGPSRLGMCFDVLAPTVPTTDGAHRDPKAKWEKGMMDVMLQIARRAEDARERIRSGKGRPADDVPSASSTRMPSQEILTLIENWQKAHYKKGSPLQKIMKERLRAAVLEVVKENALAASSSSAAMDGLTKPATPSRHHSSSMRKISRNTSSVVLPPSNSSPTKSAGTGLEPLMPEIQHLGERIARLVIFHSKVYGKLYEVDGFIDTKL